MSDDPTRVNARFDALIVSDRPGGPLTDVARLAEGRVVATVGWNDVAAHLRAMCAAPVVLLDAADAADDAIDAALPAIDTIAAERDLPVVAGIAERQIDLVSAGLSRAKAELLCWPTPAEWIGAIAIAQAKRAVFHDRVSESEAARLARLNAEVARIADVLARLSQRGPDPSPEAIADMRPSFEGRPIEPIAIDAAEIRQVIRARRLRDKHFGGGLFEDPAWDMMLDLFAAELERAQVSVSSLCIAAAVAPTTALRWIGKMTEAGLFERQPDPFDRRRAFMGLSARALDGMRAYVSTARALGLPIA